MHGHHVPGEGAPDEVTYRLEALAELEALQRRCGGRLAHSRLLLQQRRQQPAALPPAALAALGRARLGDGEVRDRVRTCT